MRPGCTLEATLEGSAGLMRVERHGGVAMTECVPASRACRDLETALPVHEVVLQ
jgi:hypothetical protein